MKFISRNDGVNYRQFVQSMDEMLQRVELKEIKVTDRQCDQMQALFKCEKQFRDILISTEKGRHMYEMFIDFIVNERANILDSRIYFRERQHTLTQKLFPMIKAKNAVGLQKFHINYYFVNWVLERYPHRARKELFELKNKIVDLRQSILSESLPSVINSVKTFTDKFEYSQLEYMDFIQSATEGFISAIDQYEPPYKKNFGAVVTYRMKLFMMESHNDSFLKIEQQNKRILYRIRKAQNEFGIEEPSSKKEFDKIHKYVSQSFKGKTIKDIQELTSSMSVRGFNEIYDKDETVEGEMVGVATPESAMVKNTMLNSLVNAWKDLTLFEQKLLLLKFGQLDFLH